MGDSPDVSVVMSVYNDALYLREAVESVLHQEGVTFEFIIVDDGSTDGSGHILDEFAAKDSRIRLVRQENQGLTRALIVGCAMARGKYIARQDSDDFSFPGRLKRLASELDKTNETVLASSSVVLMGPQGEMLLESDGQIDAGECDTFCHGSLMFRRDGYLAVGGYRAEFRAAQDVDLQLRLAERGKFQVAPYSLYAHRISNASISARSTIQKTLSTLAGAARDSRRGGLDETASLAQAARLSAAPPQGERSEPGTGNYFIGRCLYAQRDRRAVRYLWASSKAKPLSIRAWLALAQAAVITRSTRGQDVTREGILPRRSVNERKGASKPAATPAPFFEK